LCLVVLKVVLSIQRTEALNVKYIMVTSILVVGGFLVGRNIFPLPTPHNNTPMVNEAQVFDAANRPYKQIEEAQKDKIEAEPVDDNLLSHVQNKTATSLDALKAQLN
jgi:myo-inositol catabolism protein IolC